MTVSAFLTKRTLKKNKSKPWLSTFEHVHVYTYEFLRPCGHEHRCSTFFDTYDEAHAHEAWARENTLCHTCYLASLSPESWRTLNWRWYEAHEPERETDDYAPLH